MGVDILAKLIKRPKNKVFVLKEPQFFPSLKRLSPEFRSRPQKSRIIRSLASVYDFYARTFRHGTFRRQDFYAPGLLGTWTFRRAKGKSFFFQEKKFFSQKQVFFQKKRIFSKKHFFYKKTFFFKKFFFFQMTVFFQIKTFSKKKLFPTKKFYFIKNVVIFKAFHQLFVKKNRQNRERRKRNGYRKKPSSDWLEKDC